MEQKLCQYNTDETSPFSDRHLWSSSLLLTPSGRQEILHGHLDFLRAGCDVISTVTYQLSHYLCERSLEKDKIDTDNETSKGIDDDSKIMSWTEESVNWYLRMAYRIATESILLQSSSQDFSTRERYIMTSIGSYGGALADGSEYTGEYGDVTFDALKDFHRKRFEVFKNIERKT